MEVEGPPLFVGEREGCLATIGGLDGCYTYVLRRPDGRPFYVGQGTGYRVFDHENEARHPNGPRSNSHKLNVIRAIQRSGAVLRYEIDRVFPNKDGANARETELIARFKRLHEGGTLTNRHPGGGSTSGISPFSREKHAATLGGIPDDDFETATLNRFVLAIGPMDSIVLKPVSRFRPRPTMPHPKKKTPSLRQAIALAATAAANGVVLVAGARLPRAVVVDGIRGVVENGVSCRIMGSGMATVISAADPADEVFLLSESQARTILGYIGFPKANSLGIAP
jgi:uncharacterized protein